MGRSLKLPRKKKKAFLKRMNAKLTIEDKIRINGYIDSGLIKNGNKKKERKFKIK